MMLTTKRTQALVDLAAALEDQYAIQKPLDDGDLQLAEVTFTDDDGNVVDARLWRDENGQWFVHDEVDG